MLASNILCRFKAVVCTAIYNKVVKLSSYRVRETNLGKLINLVSNDLNSADVKLIILFFSMTVPFALLTVLAILFVRLGPIGLIILPMIILYFMVQKRLGQRQASNLQIKTKVSDERYESKYIYINNYKYQNHKYIYQKGLIMFSMISFSKNQAD